MSADELVIPNDMATPEEVELKTSAVDPLKIGMLFLFIWMQTSNKKYASVLAIVHDVI